MITVVFDGASASSQKAKDKMSTVVGIYARAHALPSDEIRVYYSCRNRDYQDACAYIIDKIQKGETKFRFVGKSYGAAILHKLICNLVKVGVLTVEYDISCLYVDCHSTIWNYHRVGKPYGKNRNIVIPMDVRKKIYSIVVFQQNEWPEGAAGVNFNEQYDLTGHTTFNPDKTELIDHTNIINSIYVRSALERFYEIS